MFKLVPRSHLAQSFVSTFLYDGCAISSQKKNKIRKNRDRLKFSHHMHQCQTDRLWAQTQCQFYKSRSDKLSKKSYNLFKFCKTNSGPNLDLIVGWVFLLKSRWTLFYRFKNQENLHCAWIYSLLSNNLPVNTMLAKTKQIAHTCEMQSGSSALQMFPGVYIVIKRSFSAISAGKTL